MKSYTKFEENWFKMHLEKIENQALTDRRTVGQIDGRTDGRTLEIFERRV